MSDAAAAPAKPAAKKAAAKPKKPKAAASHPPVADMVNAAIVALKERNGSSLPAIKKYIAANYKCDVAKLAPFIRRYLRKGVADGKLKQIKASYKVDKTKAEPKKKVVKAKKPKSPKKAAAKPKKPKTPKKKAAAKPKADKPKKPKTPKKAAKPKKTPKKAAAKPKKPAAKKPAAKKPAAKKPAKK